MENHEPIGCLVVSKAGRDSGITAVVTASAENYVFIVDGRLHRTENPKKKKLKHVDFIIDGEGKRVVMDSDKLTNRRIREFIRTLTDSE